MTAARIDMTVAGETGDEDFRDLRFQFQRLGYSTHPLSEEVLVLGPTLPGVAMDRRSARVYLRQLQGGSR